MPCSVTSFVDRDVTLNRRRMENEDTITAYGVRYEALHQTAIGRRIISTAYLLSMKFGKTPETEGARRQEKRKAPFRVCTFFSSRYGELYATLTFVALQVSCCCAVRHPQRHSVPEIRNQWSGPAPEHAMLIGQRTAPSCSCLYRSMSDIKVYL
jgi:hypothetical protein